MEYLLKRYDHFFQIIVANPDHVVVPTLDIDLAWHTHQLCPGRYYNFSIGKVGFLIDHKDRVDEDKLSEAFEWTTKTYQTMFQQIYSECACWYCEGQCEDSGFGSSPANVSQLFAPGAYPRLAF